MLSTCKEMKGQHIFLAFIVCTAAIFCLYFFVINKEGFADFGSFISSGCQQNYDNIYLTSNNIDSMANARITKYYDGDKIVYFFNGSLPDARGGDYHSTKPSYEFWLGKDFQSLKKVGNIYRDSTGEYKFTYNADTSEVINAFQVTLTKGGVVYKVLSS